MKNNKWIQALLVIFFLAVSQTGHSTEVTPFKNLVFPQVAAGGLSPAPNYQSWLTLTNRGTTNFYGIMHLYTGKGAAWTPYVNGVQVTTSIFSFTIVPGATITYKVTLPGATESGYIVIGAASETLNNMTSIIEGSLTYYVDTLADSIGVLPAKPFNKSILPFEDFNAVCLALVDANLDADTVASLKLYNDAGILQDTQALGLVRGEHNAKYLWQLFSTVSPSFGRGRLEISSEVPLVGTALTQISGGQFSSMSLESMPVTYSITCNGFTGSSPLTLDMPQLSLWTEGSYVLDGYARIGINGTYRMYPIYGYLYGGVLAFYAYDASSRLTLITTLSSAYVPGQSSFSGKITVYSSDQAGILGYANYAATLAQ